jgi:hypothetical protein
LQEASGREDHPRLTDQPGGIQKIGRALNIHRAVQKRVLLAVADGGQPRQVRDGIRAVLRQDVAQQGRLSEIPLDEGEAGMRPQNRLRLSTHCSGTLSDGRQRNTEPFCLPRINREPAACSYALVLSISLVLAGDAVWVATTTRQPPRRS